MTAAEPETQVNNSSKSSSALSTEQHSVTSMPPSEQSASGEPPPWSKLKSVATEMATKASQLTDSMFGHMFSGDARDAPASTAMARRRAMMLIDVLVERHGEGPLKRRWLLAAALTTFCYLHYALPAFASWGTRHFETSVHPDVFTKTVGGPFSRVSFGVLVLVTLSYIAMLVCSRRFMEARLPIKRVIFETLVVYNITQMSLNAYVFLQLLRQARMQGFPYPWGNTFVYTQDSHRLGYYIWLHYHCCQLELLDTLFVMVRKKFQKITFLHVWLRLMNMWAWFFACRFACGGDAYFPAAANAGTRAVVYAFYSLSLVSRRGAPFLRKARVTSVQMLQFGLCAMHAAFCMYNFWNMQVPRGLLVAYFVVMLNGLMLYTDFHYQVMGKSEARAPTSRNVSFAFDSSGWFYCYHFGVAAWLRQHLLPEGLSPEESETEKFPSNLTFSGSSGGALVASVLSMGLDPADVFERVLEKQPECKWNPFRMLPAVEDVVAKMLPENAYKSLTGRLRVLLTRVSYKYPFFTAEVVNKFRNNQDVFHALRATCHVPILGGFGPYRYDNHRYFDGMFWPQVMVPWRGTHDDFVVRVNVLLVGPTTDIRPPMLPTWWSVFPPSESVLRGLFWMGYENAARWFSKQPSDALELLSCRRSSFQDEAPSSPEFSGTAFKGRRRQRLDSDHTRETGSSTWDAAQTLLLRKLDANNLLPDVDTVTGRKPADLVKECKDAIDFEMKKIAAVAASFFVLAASFFASGWL